MAGRLVPLSKSYLGNGEWGKATRVGAAALRRAGKHADAKGVTEADANHKARLSSSMQLVRGVASREKPDQVHAKKGRLIAHYKDNPLGDGTKGVVGFTTPAGVPKGHGQRQSNWVMVTGEHPEYVKHESVHAMTHRKPMSWYVRTTRPENSHKLWGEEARADYAMKDHGKGISGYHAAAHDKGYRQMFDRFNGEGDNKVNNLYARSHPGHYREVQRRLDLAGQKPGKGFTVSTKGEAQPTGKKRRLFVVGRRGETVQKREMTSEQIKHRKRVQAGIATTTATLGLAALGTRGAGAVAGRVGRFVPHAQRLNNASTTLTTVGAGAGGVGGYNYASYTRAEGKKKR